MRMASLKAAKETLDHTVTAYKCSKYVIKRTLESEDVDNERTLNNKMKSLNDALVSLNILTHRGSQKLILQKSS